MTNRPRSEREHGERPSGAHSRDDEIGHLELRAKQLELETRQVELEKAKLESGTWNSPLGVAIAGALLGGIGALFAFGFNVYVEEEKAANQLEVEKAKLRNSLIISSISTGDTATAAKNLKFFVEIGAIDDPGGKIAKLTGEGQTPVLPAPANATAAEQQCSELKDARVTRQDIVSGDVAAQMESCVAPAKFTGLYLYSYKVENKSQSETIQLRWEIPKFHTFQTAIEPQRTSTMSLVSASPPIPKETQFYINNQQQNPMMAFVPTNAEGKTPSSRM